MVEDETGYGSKNRIINRFVHIDEEFKMSSCQQWSVTNEELLKKCN